VHSSSGSSSPRKATSSFSVKPYNTRLEVLPAMLVKILVFMDVTPLRTINNYQHFKADDMVQHPRRAETPSALL
jgi:hypothetical protein